MKRTPRRANSHSTSVGCLIGLLCLGMVVGCGSKTDDKPAPVPPAPSPQTETDSSTTDPPGAIELPDGDIPTDDAQDKNDSNGGLQLPDKPIDTEAAKTDSVNIQYATWPEIEKQATSAKRITVVDVWSTVCAPCIKEFPGLVKLHKEQGENIQCISVDVDFDGRKTRPPKHYEPAVVGFLTSVGANLSNYICSTPSDDVFAELDIVSIPAVLIYDADGKLIKRFIDADETAGFTYEKDIVPFLATLGN